MMKYKFHYFIVFITLKIVLLPGNQQVECMSTEINPKIPRLNMTKMQFDMLHQLKLKLTNYNLNKKEYYGIEKFLRENTQKLTSITGLFLKVIIGLLMVYLFTLKLYEYAARANAPAPVLHYKLVLYKEKRFLYNLLFSLYIVINIALLAYVLYQRYNMKYKFKNVKVTRKRNQNELIRQYLIRRSTMISNKYLNELHLKNQSFSK